MFEVIALAKEKEPCATNPKVQQWTEQDSQLWQNKTPEAQYVLDK